MATKRQKVGHKSGKNCSTPSTPQKIDFSHRRITPKSCTPVSPKSIPCYLKPTISSSNEVCHKYLIKSLDKTSSSKMKTPQLGRPIVVKIRPKQRETKTSSQKKVSSVVEERKVEASDISESSIPPSNEQNEEEPKLDLAETVDEEEVVTCDVFEISQTQETTPSDTFDIVLEAAKVHEEGPMMENAEETSDNKDTNNPHHEEEGENYEKQDNERHSPAHSQASEPHEDIEGEQGEEVSVDKMIDCGETSASTDIENEDMGHKMKFLKVKEIAMEEIGEWIRRLNFKEKNVEDILEELKKEVESVTLRHQVVQGNKEATAFNLVIEEMASKLVEESKSKVKALVGAFETVISLQDDGRGQNILLDSTSLPSLPPRSQAF